MPLNQFSNRTREIERLRARISELVLTRDQSSADRRAWELACSEFHRAFEELSFPGGPAMWGELVTGGSQGIEAAVQFLESDPYFFRSGYMQQATWHRLKRAPLTAKQKRRLDLVAMEYLSRPIRREFWDMVRYVRLRGTESLWSELRVLIESEDRSLSTRAGWLLLARQDSPVKSWVDTELILSRYREGYVPNFCFNDRIRGAPIT
jgi:hypothetical protein